MVKKVNRETISKQNLREKKDFKKYLEEIEDPNYEGGAYDCPENPTSLEKMKYDVCQSLLGYKLVKKLSTDDIAKKIGLSKAETEEILFCRIEKFTLDRLVTYAGKLFTPKQMWVNIGAKTEPKQKHA